MTELYWACSEADVEPLTGLLPDGRSSDRAGSSNHLGLIQVSAPQAAVLRLTFELLAAKKISSAALLSAPLAPDDLWIAREWSNRMVVATDEVPKIEALADRLSEEGKYDDREFIIFALRRPAPDRVAAHEVRERPSEFYGDLADPAVGGANVLYAAGREAAEQRGWHGDVVAGAPEDFGFVRDSGLESIVAWRRQAVIEAHAVGFGLESDDELAALFAAHELEFDEDAFRAKAVGWLNQGLRFGVGVVLIGLQDPPVVVPVGSVFQQPVIGSSMQNLAVAQAANPVVAAGATVPLILPAWCLNPSFSPPSGPLAPTPLVLPAASGSQAQVWDDVRARYEELT